MLRIASLLAAAAFVVAACSPNDSETVESIAEGTESTGTSQPSADTPRTTEPPSGSVPDDRATPADLETALQALVAQFGPLLDGNIIGDVTSFGDRSAGWILSDMMRFYPLGSDNSVLLARGLGELDFDVDPNDPWSSSTDQLIAEDIPAPPGYDALKVDIFTQVDDRWASLFSQPVDMDLRYLSWGGVFIDDRPLGESAACFGRGCIPALDFPAVTDAAGGDWYPDDRIVFGIVVDGEARAYPKNQMQIHEMVNDIIGGRRVGIPYCTLCGSAQAYFTDNVEGTNEPLTMRTSGLLTRSNKVMYDLNSDSIFDTFTGHATTGVHGAADVRLEQISVRVATWADWKAAHPDTTIVAPDGGVGRLYPEDPLAGRDDNGPIFPIGDVDDRLLVQDPVIGVESPSEGPVAFSVADLDASDGADVTFAGVTIRTDGAGYVAFDADGGELATHEAFWFAWSQFWPDTQLWSGGS